MVERVHAGELALFGDGVRADADPLRADLAELLSLRVVPLSSASSKSGASSPGCTSSIHRGTADGSVADPVALVSNVSR
jgi:hypothetical protein